MPPQADVELQPRQCKDCFALSGAPAGFHVSLSEGVNIPLLLERKEVEQSQFCHLCVVKIHVAWLFLYRARRTGMPILVY